MKVYVIDLDQLDEVLGSDDYSDEDFISISEQQGLVYTLKNFQNAFNYTDTINDSHYYIRFIGE